MSRQAEWAKKMLAAGRCKQCGELRGEDGTAMRCRRCLDKDSARRRKIRDRNRTSVDSAAPVG